MSARRWVALNEDGQRIGETHPRATLTDHDIDLMFALREGGMQVKVIAEKFDITRRHASRVLNCHQRNQTAARWRKLSP
jgi:hypothetical protein